MWVCIRLLRLYRGKKIYYALALAWSLAGGLGEGGEPGGTSAE